MCINPDILVGEPIHKKQEVYLESNIVVETSCTNGLFDVNVFDEMYSNEICYQKTGSQFIGAGVCQGKENEPILSRAVTSVQTETECEQTCRQTYGCQGFMYTDSSAYKINGATSQDIKVVVNGDSAKFGTPANITWQCHHFMHPHFPTYTLSQAAPEFVYPDCFTIEGNCDSKSFIENTDADITQQPFLCFRLSIYFPEKYHTTQTISSDLATPEDIILYKGCEPGNIGGITLSSGGNITIVVDNNHCDSSPCKNGGTCTEQDGGYTCTCQNGDGNPGSGYEGVNCELTCGAVYWPSPYAHKICCPEGTDVTKVSPYNPGKCVDKGCLNCEYILQNYILYQNTDIVYDNFRQRFCFEIPNDKCLEKFKTALFQNVQGEILL